MRSRREHGGVRLAVRVAGVSLVLALVGAGTPASGADPPALRGMLGAYPDMPDRPVPGAVAAIFQKLADAFVKLHGGLDTATPGGISAESSPRAAAPGRAPPDVA